MSCSLEPDLEMLYRFIVLQGMTMRPDRLEDAETSPAQ